MNKQEMDEVKLKEELEEYCSLDNKQFYNLTLHEAKFIKDYILDVIYSIIEADKENRSELEIYFCVRPDYFTTNFFNFMSEFFILNGFKIEINYPFWGRTEIKLSW